MAFLYLTSSYYNTLGYKLENGQVVDLDTPTDADVRWQLQEFYQYQTGLLAFERYLLCKLYYALTQPNSQNAFNHPTSHVLYIFETP